VNFSFPDPMKHLKRNKNEEVSTGLFVAAFKNII
jgi:hypothetical protein